uniref:protein GUCD1 isoform X4 n=1 Tax=Myxine glutinosa TaxID=7769 RepID=UPI00359006AA
MGRICTLGNREYAPSQFLRRLDHDDGTNLHIGESRICSFTVSWKDRQMKNTEHGDTERGSWKIRFGATPERGSWNWKIRICPPGSATYTAVVSLGLRSGLCAHGKYARGVSEEEFLAAYHKLGLGQSVWTIDLAFLMATMNLSHHYCTQTLGVNRSYENQEFYHHDFATDELRVNRRFADAANSGVKVEKSYCCFGSALPSRYPCHKHQYQGHFVTVCGYSHPDGSVFYNNPTCDRMCICTVKNFNEARTSYGTDEDILFVYKDAR